MKISFSIIICTLNRLEYLKKCIKSIIDQNEKFDYEIIIVDQSEISSEEELKGPNIKYIQNSRKGLSRNRNIALKNATGNIICIMDDDATVSPNYFRDINDIFVNHPNIDLGCGIILNNEDKLPFSRHMKKDCGSPISLYNIDRCLSSAMFFKSVVYDKIGGFDKNFGIGSRYGGSEEAEFLVRAILSGFLAHGFIKPEVYHPKFIIEDLCSKQLVNKGVSYGKGRGALFKKFFKKLPIWSLLYFFKSLLISFTGLFFSLIKLQFKSGIWYLSNFYGRAVGFVIYKKW